MSKRGGKNGAGFRESVRRAQNGMLKSLLFKDRNIHTSCEWNCYTKECCGVRMVTMSVAARIGRLEGFRKQTPQSQTNDHFATEICNQHKCNIPHQYEDHVRNK